MTTRADEKSPPRSAWFPVVAPIVVWAIHGAVSVVVTLSACGGHHDVLVRAIVLGGGACALAVIVVGAVRALKAVDQSDGQREPFTRVDRSVREFVARVGLLSSLVFGIAVIWSMLPGALVAHLCEVGR